MINLIVTQHKSLVKYLQAQGLAPIGCEVIAHATKKAVAGRHVLGVLPHSLSSLAKSFTEVPLNLPQELRGKELTYEEIVRYAGKPQTYEVRLQFVTHIHDEN